MNTATATFNPPTFPADENHRYVYHDPRIGLAVKIALVTRRPLLITGLPGSGKSTLARDVANHLQWAYIETTITSRTRLDDLVGSVDLVRRLSDAQTTAELEDDAYYLVPGILWWAVSPETARERPGVPARDPRIYSERASSGIVVLLDEMDKAEPDLPNDLLKPLDQLQITVPFVGDLTPTTEWLVVITSNGERAMSPAFLRRCVSLELDEPGAELLANIARSHYGARRDDLYKTVAEYTVAIRAEATGAKKRPPSTAEYLDTVEACRKLDVRPGMPLWEDVVEATLRKVRRRPDAERSPE